MKRIIYILMMGFFLGCSQVENLKLKKIKSKEIAYNLIVINTAKGQGVLKEGIGYSRVSTIIKRAQNKYGKSSVLYLDAGGNFSGTQITDKTKGSSSVAIFNGIKLKATTLREEDFKYGIDNLERIKERSNFKIITTNIKKSNGDIFLDYYLIEKIKDKKIGIMGVVSPKIIKTLKEEDSNKILIEDPIKSTKTAVKLLKKQGVNFIIVLSSLENINKELAKEIKGIDLIITMEDKDVMKEGNTWIVSSKEKLASLGITQIDLNADKKNESRINYKSIKSEDIKERKLLNLSEDYLIKKGDTLYSLAKKYKTTVERLIKLNPQIKDGETIKINHKYRVPILEENFNKEIKNQNLKKIEIVKDLNMEEIIEKINKKRI